MGEGKTENSFYLLYSETENYKSLLFEGVKFRKVYHI